MTPYKNLNGTSGIVAYLIEPEQITVNFGEMTYLYTNRSAGSDTILLMHQLAQVGKGLNAFINTHISKSYEARWPTGQGQQYAAAK